MADRLWGLPFLLMGLFYVRMSREQLKRQAESGAREAGQIFPWMSERRVNSEARTQYFLLRVIPPIFVILGVLILLGLIPLGA